MTVRSTCADSRALPDARRYCPRVLFGDDFSFMAGDSIPRCILLIVLIFAVGVFSYCNRTRMKTFACEGSTAAKRVVEILAKYDKNTFNYYKHYVRHCSRGVNGTCHRPFGSGGLCCGNGCIDVICVSVQTDKPLCYTIKGNDCLYACSLF